MWYTHISKKASIKLGVCHRCLGIMNTKAPIHLICKCADAPSGQPSSATHRAKAREAYQARALKRAREEQDPFA